MRLLKADFPSGGIIMWSGSVGDIPGGWGLCDGTKGTPDLRNKFVVGAGSTYGVGATGGSKDAVIVEHSHEGRADSAGGHTHDVSFNAAKEGTGTNPAGFKHVVDAFTRRTSSAGMHSHGLSINRVGESGVDKNLPPYFALAYIMKI